MPLTIRRDSLSAAVGVLMLLSLWLASPVMAEESTETVTIEYARLTAGGSVSISNDIVLSDSITLHQGAIIQSASEYEILPVKTLGNNGIATAIGANSARLQWTALLNGTSSTITVLRGDSEEGPWETIETLDGQQTEYVDDSLESSTTYYYKVLVTDSEGQTVVLFGPVRVTTQEQPQAPHGIKKAWHRYK